ncbi:MAG: 1-acyl-sn-glycerol-3-phosphate acyltransferase [Lachnospiraceae bacterium]|nr:1-acyl-sn-glycerol-3-phosphate acyltransferase [Lachnospiraceae bacterium]MBQ7777106.1 1-acyl-sn-glycerol-3-phosphate acyltransferase [Lachnospiraceae bacterium]
MLVNKRKDMTPFDMKRPPMRQKWYLMPLIWSGSWLMTRQFKLKINKKNMEGFKSPYLVIATHQGFSDYYIAPLALFPYRANYVSDMEGFAAFGEWLYRAIGCIGKRRYVSDITVVKNVKYALEHKQSVVIYPESRHSNVGTTAFIPPNIGKLVKMMKVPLVVLTAHGSYLANPFWDEEHTRKVPMEATLEGVYTAEEVEKLSVQEIQRVIEEKLQYDEYRWQQEKGIQIRYDKRAEGLHKALYQCRECGAEYHMKSQGASLFCEKCGVQWELTTHGKLEKAVVGMDMTDASQIHIPDWYEWQRRNVIEEIEAGKYSYIYKVQVEALPNSKGFVPMGEGKLVHNQEGFCLAFGEEQLFFDHSTHESVQTEYNYRGKGMGIVLSTKDCCYYIYSQDESFQPTKIQFAGEYLHQRGKVQ